MASLAHIAIGLAAGRLHGGTRRKRAAVLYCGLSMLPDADVIGFSLGIPYGAEWGHRGASHSLLMGLIAGLVVGLLLQFRGWPIRRTMLLAALVTMSHGLLDALTNGGLGIALFWPWSLERHFAPWQPILVAPIGLDMLSPRGARVLALEALYFAPLLVYGLWPARRSRPPA